MIIEATTLATTLALLAPGWLPSGHRWSMGQFPIPYCITGNAHSTSLTAAQQRTAVTNAINQWRGGVGLSCSLYDAVAQPTASCHQVRDSNDGQNNIYWVSAWTQGSQTIGVTWSSFIGNCGSVNDSTGRHWNLQCSADSDIEFNDADYTWSNSGSDTDIASIAVHEYGHFIGLDHCNDNNSCQLGTGVMYAAYPGGTIRVPFNDDVQGACALYPGTQGGTGWPCTSTGDCSAAPICVNAGSNGYCTQTCGTCPQGYICRPNPQNAAQNVCLRDDGLNRGLCEICQAGLPNACANMGQCFSHLPEANVGRCVTPCPNPADVAHDGGCPTNYGCFQVTVGSGTENFCFPKSSDCTNLTNFTELQMGQNCNGNPPCATGLDCIGICSQTCTGGPGQGNCPSGYACETFNFQSGPESYCAPPVNEGQNCNGVVACTTGPCLLSGQNIATCYKDCAGHPAACNNAQMCNTYNLQGGGSVSICEPPGVPPRPDAGFPPDTGTPTCLCDISTACDNNCACDPDCAGQPDAGTNPEPDSGTVNPGNDAGTNPAPDASMGGGECACDKTYGCDPHCDQCDPECQCACDQTFECDRGCEACDPECKGGGGGCSGCTSTEGERGRAQSPWALVGVLILAAALLGTRRYRR